MAEKNDELDSLLDDALQDFDKNPSASQPSEKSDTASANNAEAFASQFPADGTVDHEAMMAELLGDEAILQLTKDFGAALEELAGKDPDMMSEFQKFSQEAAVAAAAGGPMPDIDENVAKALNELSKNFQDMTEMHQQGGGTDDAANLANMMGGLDMGATAPESSAGDDLNFDADGFIDVMQGMMKNLLSKELLYPSLKEINDRFPKWLSENESHSEYQMYVEQSKVVKELCTLFEEEKEDDSEDVKRTRGVRVVELMQQMQMYGHPPQDMMADVVGASPDDGAGEGGEQQPMPEQCVVM